MPGRIRSRQLAAARHSGRKSARLFQGDEDGFEAYEDILPRDLSDVGDIPAGRSGSGTIAFTVPKNVPLDALALYIGGDSEYGEWAIR